MTFKDKDNDGVIDTSDIKQINHYYPFGLNMEGNWNGSFAEAKNKYQYNGKELNTDFGLEWNDYGARFYDAAIGRFPIVDPLSEIYHFQSPYAYAGNNPVKNIDLLGMASIEANANETNLDDNAKKNKANNKDGRKGITSDIYLDERGFEIGKISDNKADHFYRATRTAKGNLYVYYDLGSDRPPLSPTASVGDVPESSGLDDVLQHSMRFPAQDRGGEMDGLSCPIFTVMSCGLFSGVTKMAVAEGGATGFFEGTNYTTKVLGQMKRGDFHAFPEAVKAFESEGVVSSIKGGDRIVRKMLKIPGEYRGKKGAFEFIKEANGNINHRLFNPNH